MQLYSDRKLRACQKLANGPGVGKCPVPGQCKICKCPTPGTDKEGRCPAVAWGGGGAGRSWNWPMHNNYIDVYIIWVMLEVLPLNVAKTPQCTGKYLTLTCSHEFYWHKLNASPACYIHFLKKIKIKKPHTHTRVTYGTCAYQFNKFVLINYNTRVALLTGLTNWLPWGKWNACSLFLWAQYKAKRYWLQNIIQLNW